MFVRYEQSYTTTIYIRKFAAGLLYDAHLFIILYSSFLLLSLISKKMARGYLITFTFIACFLNIVNYFVSTQFLDGLASPGMIAEYAKDSVVLLKTGAGSGNLLPLILMVCPILLLLLNKSFSFYITIKTKKHIFLVALLLISTTSIAKIVRVNKYHILGDNTVLRMLKNDIKNQNYAFKKELLDYSLTNNDLKILNSTSLDYPLIKDGIELSNVKLPKDTNIIIIMLESVSIHNTQILEINNPNNYPLPDEKYTPYFNSLLKDSAVFTNFFSHTAYTAGGQVSLLCSVYDNLFINDGTSSIMRNLYGFNFKCLPEYLKEAGYTSLFFNGFTKEFDNKVNFFGIHGFDEIVCRDEIKDYLNIEEFQHEWGFFDDQVFNTMFSKLEKLDKPFFSLLMTVDTHPPFTIGQKNPILKNPNPYLNSLAWTDRHLKDFMERAKETTWFNNTLFIITSDNGGGLTNVPKEFSSYNHHLAAAHIPFVLYYPNNPSLFRQVNNKIAGQISIAPTILDLLGISSINHFLGKSLFLDEKNDYVYIYRWFNNHLFYDGHSINDIANNKIIPINDMSVHKTNYLQLRKAYSSLLIKNRIWKSE